jgi:hypothetical protein
MDRLRARFQWLVAIRKSACRSKLPWFEADEGAISSHLTTLRAKKTLVTLSRSG